MSEVDLKRFRLFSELTDAEREAVAELPADLRECVELRYFGGLSLARVAEATGLALRTVNLRLRKARDRMQARLADTVPAGVLAFLAGAALVFLTTMKELPATLILAPIGFKTLATSVWSAVSEAFFAQAAAPALLIILVSSLPTAILIFREKSYHD